MCTLEILPRYLLSVASICLFIEACYQVALRVRLHLVCETCNMCLLGILVLAGWLCIVFNKPKAGRACYAAYALELLVDAMVMFFAHPHFYSPSHFFLQLSTAFIILAFCKQHYVNPRETREKGPQHGNNKHSR